MRGISKILGVACFVAIMLTSFMMFSDPAFAIGYTADDLGSKLGAGAIKPVAISEEGLSRIATDVMNWLFVIVIIVFGFKIGVTALNKGVFGLSKNEDEREFFVGWPIIGAYPTKETWPTIWKTFGFNLFIVLFAWGIIRILVGAGLYAAGMAESWLLI